MNTPETCERAYRRGHADYIQIRTASGRLVATAREVEAVERFLTGRRVLWRRFENRWLARSA